MLSSRIICILLFVCTALPLRGSSELYILYTLYVIIIIMYNVYNI